VGCTIRSMYDDPAHAEIGLEAARKYAKVAAAFPHALHMPSHIFTRLGYWDESATTNEKAWQTSESDVKRAGESSSLRDFHSLNRKVARLCRAVVNTRHFAYRLFVGGNTCRSF